MQPFESVERGHGNCTTTTTSKGGRTGETGLCAIVVDKFTTLMHKNQVSVAAAGGATPNVVVAGANGNNNGPSKSSLFRPSGDKQHHQSSPLLDASSSLHRSFSPLNTSSVDGVNLSTSSQPSQVLTKAQILAEVRRAGGGGGAQQKGSSGSHPHAGLGRSPSPERSPQRASSPTRETISVGQSHQNHSSSQQQQPTTQQPVVPRSTAVQRLLQPMNSRTTGGSGGAVESSGGPSAAVSDHSVETAPPTKSGVIVEMLPWHNHTSTTTAATNAPIISSGAASEIPHSHHNSCYVDPAAVWYSLHPHHHDAPGNDEFLLRGTSASDMIDGDIVDPHHHESCFDTAVSALDYLTACDDIKQIAKERDEVFPRCADVPAEVRVTLDALQHAISSSSSTSSSSSFVACQVAKVLVSRTAPSAVRCVIPDNERTSITSQYFERQATSNTTPPFWIKESGELIIQLAALQPGLARSIVSGSAPALRFQLPFFVEDTSIIVIDPKTMVPSTKKSPQYHVDVLIGAPPSSSSVVGDAATSSPGIQQAGSESAASAVRAMRGGAGLQRLQQQLHGGTKKAKDIKKPAGESDSSRSQPTATSSPAAAGDDDRNAYRTAAPSAEGLPTIPIHSFRPLPDLIGPAYVGATYVLTQPLMCLRSISELGERRLLRKDLLVRVVAGDGESPPQTTTPSSSNNSSVVLTQEEARSASVMLLAALDEQQQQQAQGGGGGPPRIQEILFQLIPLLSQIGGQESTEKAASLAHLRVQLQCRALGLSEKALVGPAEDLPLALLAGGVVAHTTTNVTGGVGGGGGGGGGGNDDRSNTRSPTSQLRFVASLLLDQLRIAEHLLQYLIECAHLHKHLGKYRDALRWYRVGLLVANLLRGQDSYHKHAAAAASDANPSSPPPPRRGGRSNNNNHHSTAASIMIPNDETGLLPFLRAIGDVSLTIGNTEEAIGAYEMARAFSEMKSRISLGTTALGHPHHHSGGNGNGEVESSLEADVLLHPHNTRTLEFDAALAVAATLGGHNQTAHTALHRCEKTLEESSSYRKLSVLASALGNLHSSTAAQKKTGVVGKDASAEVEAFTAAERILDQQLREVPSEERDSMLEQCETSIEILAHLAYCCIAKDSTTQGRKYLERAMSLVQLAEALVVPQEEEREDSSSSSSLSSTIALVTAALRGDLLMLRGWSYLRRSILASGCHPSDDAQVVSRTISDGVVVSSGGAAASDDDDEDRNDDDGPTKGCTSAVAATQLNGAASASFAAACHAYCALPCRSDAAGLIMHAMWLQHTCCDEHTAKTQTLLESSIKHYCSREHPLTSCVSLTLALLRAGYWKANENLLMHEPDVLEEGEGLDHNLQNDRHGNNGTTTKTRVVANYMLRKRFHDVIEPIYAFAHQCGVVVAPSLSPSTTTEGPPPLVPLSSVRNSSKAAQQGNVSVSGGVVALQRWSSLISSNATNSGDSSSTSYISVCPRHPLLSVLWELSAVACALTDHSEEACESLDFAAGVLLPGGNSASPTTAAWRPSDGRSPSPSVSRAASTSPPPALQGRHGAAEDAVSAAITQQSNASTERLLKCIRRDDVLLCRRLTPLAAFCFSLASHRRLQPPPPSSSTLLPAGGIIAVSQVTSALPIDRVEALIADCVRELGLDGVHANTGGRGAVGASSSASSSRRAPRIVPLELPGIFLDIAEIRLCQRDSVGCLESCSRAIRLSDERNLLYLLGPLFKPAFQLLSSDVEDRARLLRERQVVTFNTVASVSSFSAIASSASMSVPKASADSMTTLALALFTLARVHEAMGNYSQALLAFHQCYASLEMIGLASLPVATEAFIGCSRSSLRLGHIGDSVMYVDLAQELFQTHHASFGEYRMVPLLVELRDTMDHCKRTAECMMEDRNYTLAIHERRYTAPVLNGYPLYL